MKTFQKVIESVYNFLGKIGGVLLLCMMSVTVLNILLRALFNLPINGAFEIVCYLSLVMGAFAMPGVEFASANISVAIVPESLPQKARRVLRLITDAVAMVGCSFVVFKLIGTAQVKYAHGETTRDLGVPVYIYVAIIVFGFALTALCLLFKVLYFLTAKKSHGEEDKTEEPGGMNSTL